MLQKYVLQIVIGGIILIGGAIRVIAEEKTPTAGESTVAAARLKQVEALADTVFYINEEKCGKQIVDTSLYQFQIGQKEPTRLFLVSCLRVKHLDSVPGSPPVISADRYWLAWPLPVEYPESGTILLDLENQEYRILNGRWCGIQF